MLMSSVTSFHNQNAKQKNQIESTFKSNQAQRPEPSSSDAQSSQPRNPGSENYEVAQFAKQNIGRPINMIPKTVVPKT